MTHEKQERKNPKEAKSTSGVHRRTTGKHREKLRGNYEVTFRSTVEQCDVVRPTRQETLSLKSRSERPRRRASGVRQENLVDVVEQWRHDTCHGQSRNAAGCVTQREGTARATNNT